MKRRLQAIVPAAALALGGTLGAPNAVRSNSHSSIFLASLHRMMEQTSTHIEMSLDETTEGMPIAHITLTGEQDLGQEPSTAEMTMNESVVSASGNLGPPTTIRELIVGTNAYLSIGVNSAPSRRTGKTWAEFNLADFAKMFGVSDPTMLFSQGSGDPTQELALLSSTSTSGVRRVGTAVVGTVPTTEYQATVNMAKAARLRGAAYEQLLQNMRRYLASDSVVFRVYIDSTGLLRRISYNMPESIYLDGSVLHVLSAVDVSFSDFGANIVVIPPPASSVHLVPVSEIKNIFTAVTG